MSYQPGAGHLASPASQINQINQHSSLTFREKSISPTQYTIKNLQIKKAMVAKNRAVVVVKGLNNTPRIHAMRH
jgi:hypothetical protein